MRLLGLLAVVMVMLSACSDPKDPASGKSQQLASEKVWTRLFTLAPGKLRGALEREGLDVTGASQRLGTVDVYTTPERLSRLLAEHADRILASERLESRRNTLALSDYMNPTRLSQFLDQVQTNYPTLAKKVDLTPSGLFEGHHVYAMKISSNVTVDADKPTALFTGQIHAREVMTSEVTTDIIDYLTSNYASSTQVKNWVDSMNIWVIPVQNPDGAAYVFSTDEMWRRNRHPNCPVDCNRNFPWNFDACDGSSPDCNDDTCHGSGPASEPETQASNSLMAQLRPMYYIDYHSYGEWMVWPTGCFPTEEDDLYSLFVTELNNTVQTDDGQTGHWTIGNTATTMYHAPGGTDDNIYGSYGALGITIEINQDFQPDYQTYRNITVQRQRTAWQYLLNRTLTGPSVRGHTFDSGSHAPVVANFQFANHPFTSGQLPLQTDAGGRFGRALMPNSDQVVVFTASGYLPETRVVHVDQGPVDIEVGLTAGTNHAPTLVLGPDQTVNEGDLVTLDASGSFDQDGNTLFFLWTQTAGPSVYLHNPYSAKPTFFAPGVSADTQVTFQVTASDGALQSATGTIHITIRDIWNQTNTYPSTDTPKNIPDGDTTGITSIIHVSDNQPILKAVAHVDITHAYPADLIVDLTSPTGTKVVLFNHGGDGSPDIHADYNVTQVVGELSGGDWVLHVADTSAGDAGTLDDWRLLLDLVGTPPCQTAADCHLAHVSSQACNSGRCEIVTCDQGYADCNARAYDGCEVDTTSDPAHCGGCSPCSFSHAQASCQNSTCVMGTCLTGYGDCNSSPSDGCETALATDPQHCGSCTTVCQFSHAVAGCQASACTIASCDALWGNCDNNPANGCEADVSSDVQHCGTCAHACNLPNATASCVQGQCTISTCQTGYKNCDGNAANGCEINFQSDVQNCGDCGHNCQALHASVQCVSGGCVMGACLSGYDDCNNDPADGCESDLHADPANCGACGQSCNLPHTTARCLNSACLIDSCDPGFDDCNHNSNDGCEVDLTSDASHCGSCQNACQLAHATAGCSNQKCLVKDCDPAFGDCNSDPSDGCETYLNNNDSHCGTCDHQCTVPGGTASCRQGSCVLESCDSGKGNCDGDDGNGCEADLASDPKNCGSCGNGCVFAHAASLCQARTCALGACDPGFSDCNADPSDGCETDTGASPQHCGSCSNACPTGQECNNGKCQLPCADADGDGYKDKACGGDDCDDTNPAVHPGAIEVCNGIDDNCNGQIDEGLKCSQGCGCNSAGGSASTALLALFGLLGLTILRNFKEWM